MRTDNTNLHKKEEPAEHSRFKLPENKGEKNIDKAKQAPPHNLEGPVSIQLKAHITNVNGPVVKGFSKNISVEDTFYKWKNWQKNPYSAAIFPSSANFRVLWWMELHGGCLSTISFPVC